MKLRWILVENKPQEIMNNLDENEEKTGKYERVYSGFLNFLLALFSYIIPKNPKQVLIGSYLFVGNPKYFFLFLSKKKSDECKPIWITRSKNIYTRLEKDGFRVVYLKSLKGFFSILRSKYLFFSHGSRDVSYFMRLPGRFKKIQLWHAIATKQLAKPPSIPKELPFLERLTRRQIIQDRKSYHTIITCSEKTKKRDAIMFQNKNVEILGFPRNDIFFDRSNIYQDFSMKFNLKKI